MSRANGRRAGERIVHARHGRVRASSATELAQEVQSHLPVHPAPQLLSREPAPEARLARRL